MSRDPAASSSDPRPECVPRCRVRMPLSFECVWLGHTFLSSKACRRRRSCRRPAMDHSLTPPNPLFQAPRCPRFAFLSNTHLTPFQLANPKTRLGFPVSDMAWQGIRFREKEGVLFRVPFLCFMKKF